MSQQNGDHGFDAPTRVDPGWAAPTPPSPSAPAGYVTYGGMPPSVQPTATLRTASVAVRAVAAALSALSGLIYLARARAIERYQTGDASRSAIDNAQTAATVVTQVSSLASIGGLVLLCLWSARTATNGTVVHRNTGASPGLAGGGWFIPIGNCWVPWKHLRRAMAGQRSSALDWWQALTILSYIAALPLAVFVGLAAFREALDHEVTAGVVRNQGLAAFAGAALALVSTLVSVRAMRDVDAATSGPVGWTGP